MNETGGEGVSTSCAIDDGHIESAGFPIPCLRLQHRARLATGDDHRLRRDGMIVSQIQVRGVEPILGFAVFKVHGVRVCTLQPFCYLLNV